MLFRSIRTRLTALFSLALAVLLVVVILGLIWYARRSAVRSADTLVRATAKRAAAEMSDYRDPYSPADILEEERAELSGSNLVMIIVDPHGHTIAKSQRHIPTVLKNSDNWRVAKITMKNGDTIIVAMPFAKTRAAQRNNAVILCALGLFALLIASAGAWVLVGRTLMPISALSREARAASADSLTVNLALPSHDREVVELVETLNGLLRRITETTSAKGRFYSAASHELRTPLQALSGHLELALTRDRTTEEYRAVIAEAYTQAKRLIELSRTLLLLYQLDSSTGLLPQEPVDLVAVCRHTLSNLEPAIKDRHLDVTTNMPTEAVIYAPLNHIEILVRNLLDNAVNYSTHGGQVEVLVNVLSGHYSLEIVNNCGDAPEISPDNLTEPFSRLDTSRNRKTGGAGLGLAICKSITDADGWKLELMSKEGVFRVLATIPEK